ncbi:MAG: RdgB/HAM1 family non-canonical purine NTP pyrophosphatase [Pseudomonadales bacterium]|nr:RdgB/HAM1 family non-canonical purine NTP pyrophosphatase [Pseudomonadales bacterium]MBO6596694.1 RdgB/HAM1 family non-canonical purine NTP pyrophosphatase [Pseudomonadales bacterium]MBO6823317.1 RdgB/HAM1 family non-canonical purine NTP pyrophosphatase [Pseudomonadales bacterium]
MKFVMASGNLHKAEEIRATLPSDIELILQSELGVDSAEETGGTFVENALIKAKHAASVTGMPAIADDSGLCVEALGGAPGIFSARYAGTGVSDQDNVQKLLTSLEGEDRRDAFFYCVLVCLDHANDPTPLIAEARWPGTITRDQTGDGGFGYDPVFLPEGLSKTAAELSADEKNAVSHRGQALRLLSKSLRERYSA